MKKEEKKMKKEERLEELRSFVKQNLDNNLKRQDIVNFYKEKNIKAEKATVSRDLNELGLVFNRQCNRYETKDFKIIRDINKSFAEVFKKVELKIFTPFEMPFNILDEFKTNENEIFKLYVLVIQYNNSKYGALLNQLIANLIENLTKINDTDSDINNDYWDKNEKVYVEYQEITQRFFFRCSSKKNIVYIYKMFSKYYNK